MRQSSTTPPQATTAQQPTPQLEPIAIIGMGCRFPGGATSPDAFWQMLCAGTDAVVEVPPDRWSLDTFYDSDRTKPGKLVTRWGGFLDQIDCFDAQFFGISPREAAQIDPQQRLLLEVCWEALEDGGQVPDQLEGSATGVFVGGFTLDYFALNFSESNRDTLSAHSATGTLMTLLANRISYTFDFRGPSVALDTACSSSLVAVHLACQSLWNGESTLALAGGVNTMFKPEYTIAESKAGMLSPDGRCKTFDTRANGYVRGEGTGIVVLKPLTQALADGDPVYAVIRGSAVNQDGHTNGITVPNGAAQEAAITEAYRRAGITPETVQYVEAHGTGTPVGDPIEANALGRMLSQGRPAEAPCIVGSVKTNIGHLEAAAGVAGLIKSALCLQHRQIPPNLHFNTPNPHIDFAQLGLQVPQTVIPWPATDGPARASVNSFGFGGTNAHVVLEEAPPAAVEPVTPLVEQAYLLPFSARSPEALKAVAQSYLQLLTCETDTERAALADLGYTVSLRRAHHDYRLAMVARTADTLVEQLQAFVTDEASTHTTGRRMQQSDGGAAPLVFVFTGMGPQWWAMGRQLFAQEPVFRAMLERCDALLTPYTQWSLLDEMMADEADSRMAETEVSQPANFALQVALCALWRSWGIEPDAIVGHSAGEVAAVYVAGAMSLEEAVRVIFHRSRLQQRTTGQGQMAAVGIPLDDAQHRIADYADRVSIAAINSASSVTLVGDPEALAAVVEPLQAQGVFCRYLQVKVPFHSHYMNPLKPELFECLDDLILQPTDVPLYSTVTGQFIEGQELTAAHWWRNVRDPVLFAAAVEQLIDAGYTNFLEIGPHPVLAHAITETMTRQGQTGTVLTSLRRNEDEQQTLLTTLGALYTQGYPVQWSTLYPDGRVVPTPAYPWQRERHWYETKLSAQERLGIKEHPLLGQRMPAPQPTWEIELNPRLLPYLNDHQIQGTVVYPGAAYAEMALAAAHQVFGDGAALLDAQIEFRKALFLPDGDTPKLRLTLNSQTAAFDICSQSLVDPDRWTMHATGKLFQGQNQSPNRKLPLDAIRQRCATEISHSACYRQFRTFGLQYGPGFQGIERLWQGDGEACAQIHIPTSIAPDIEQYQIHPAILDVCFQVLAAVLPFADSDVDDDRVVYMPVGVERGSWRPGRFTEQMYIHATLTKQEANLLMGDIRLCDDVGNILMEIVNCRATSLESTEGATSKQPPAMYEFAWQPFARTQPATPPAEAGRWLILADSTNIGRGLAALLEEHGERCVLVAPGESYAVVQPGWSYCVNPTQPTDFQQLLRDVSQTDSIPWRGVVHLWGLDIPTAAETTLATLETATTLGTTAVLHLVQALVEAEPFQAARLWLATCGAQPVDLTDTPLAVAQAPLWGLARVLGHQEHPDRWGGIVDLDPQASAGLAAALFAEIWSGDGEDQIVLRGSERYVARLTINTTINTPLPPTFRPDGSYLITGGFGGLGLLVARWMVDHGARHLVLLGREPLPPRATWRDLAADTPLAARTAAVRELEALGAHVHIAAGDVADEAQMTAVLRTYRQEDWPPIRGVVHSAGVAYPQLLAHMSVDEFNKVLQPKVQGAWLLHTLLADEPLDFFVMFSSIAATVALAGQGNYAAGNAFMDALAHLRHAQGLPALSINWGPWADVGMATKLDLIDHFERRGLYPMSSEQGITMMEQLCGERYPQMTVVAVDWPLYGQWYPKGIIPIMIQALMVQDDAETAALPEQAQDATGDFLQQFYLIDDATARQTALQEQIHAIVARVLRLSQTRFAADQPLNTLGLDSMLAIELKNQLETCLGVTIAVVDLLQGTSVTQLTEKLFPLLQSAEHTNDDAEETDLLTELEQLSSDDVAALLNEIETNPQEATV